jgi:hypothetical protein
MADSSESSNNKKPDSASKSSTLAPPEERFWKRYSPHHEFSISSSASTAVHVIGFAVLILGAALLARLGFGARPVEVASIVIAGGGGDPHGKEGPNTGTGHEPEVINSPNPEPVTKAEAPKEELKAPEKETTPILPPPDKSNVRPIEDPGSTLMSIDKAARETMNAQMARGNRSKGKGGPGEGGGKGKGKGTGTGDLQGPGKINVEQREKRQLRWTMTFNTRDGEDYLRQLQALKAMLAIEGPNGEYLVIEDLRKRPVVPVARSLSEINRIYWIDDRPESVRSLARGLQMPAPPRFIALFPIELEQDLLRKELAYRHLAEDDIAETRFQVRATGRGYEAFVVYQSKR